MSDNARQAALNILARAKAVLPDLDTAGPATKAVPRTTLRRWSGTPKPRLSSVLDLRDVEMREDHHVVEPVVVMGPPVPHPGGNGYRYEGELVAHQMQELCRGPQRHPAFRTEGDRRRAWFDHRDRILADFEHLGITDREPWAMDRYEARTAEGATA